MNKVLHSIKTFLQLLFELNEADVSSYYYYRQINADFTETSFHNLHQVYGSNESYESISKSESNNY